MLAEIENKLKIKFKDQNLLKTAFIHRSYLNEHPDEKLGHNERLEFLGDSVLGFLVSEYLFVKYPERAEGDLTNFRSSLVNARSLAAVAADLELGKYLLLSKGEEATGGRERQYLLANTFEALLGAIYLDQGLEPIRSLINTNILPSLDKIIDKKLYKDFKSDFQEKAQEKLNVTPLYRVLGESGPDHEKIFEVGVFVENEEFGRGKGKSKQNAEQEAAKSALEKLFKIS